MYKFPIWITKNRILQHLQCWASFELTYLIILTSLSFSFLDRIKDKNRNILKAKKFYSYIPFPMQLHITNMK